MPNVHLTDAMQDYVERQLASGAYSNLSEVIRAGMRLLMQQDGALLYHGLKADLIAAADAAEAGDFAPFDVEAFEPDAFPKP
jgi:antitoxin ParD1/3/4